jgi:hypothetical protein
MLPDSLRKIVSVSMLGMNILIEHGEGHRAITGESTVQWGGLILELEHKYP